VKNIFDLYETRKILETSALKLSLERAKVEEIDVIEAFLRETGPDAADKSTEEMVHLDETFHERLMALSGNDEMLRLLKSINARIHFIRFLDFDRTSRPATQADHLAVWRC
jgi:DNA-binding GntR family transcriptional regulator